LRVCEGQNPQICGTWTFSGSQGTGRWDNGAVADLIVQQFDSNWVIIRRSDGPEGATPGLTAIYRGKLSHDRIEGTVTWTWPGHWKKQVDGTWSSSLNDSSSLAPRPEPPTGAGTPPPVAKHPAVPKGLPSIMHWCSKHCTTLVWRTDHYTEIAAPGRSIVTVESFTPESIVLNRTDVKPPGTAVLKGKLSPRGDTIVDGTITWTSHPCCELGSSPFTAAWGEAIDTVPGDDDERARRLQLAQMEGASGAMSDVERDRAHVLALRAQTQVPRGPRESSPVWLPHWHGDPVVMACPNGPTSGKGIDSWSAWRKGKSAQIIEGDGPLGTNWGHDLEALDWYCKASAAGNPIAAYDIGKIFLVGMTVNTPRKSTNFPADPATSFYWFRLAADRGFTQAMLSLARFYFYGEVLDLKGSGVAKDPKQALFWIKRAADNGDSDAMLILASAYLGLSDGPGPALGVAPDAIQGLAYGAKWVDILTKANGACIDPDNIKIMRQLLPEDEENEPVRGITAVAVHGFTEVECMLRLDGPRVRDNEPTLAQLMSLLHGGFVSSWRYYLTRPPGSDDFAIRRQTAISAIAEGFENIAPLAKAVAEAIDKHNKS